MKHLADIWELKYTWKEPLAKKIFLQQMPNTYGQPTLEKCAAPQKTDALWNYFAENWFFQCGFDFGNGNFDNDYGQTLVLDGSLMDIMVDNC